MKIAVVGCGAMGSIYAGLLADAGNQVLAVDTNRAHVDAINLRGLRISGASGDRIVMLEARTIPPARVVDLVIVAVKAAHAASAAASARPLIGPHTRILTIQNGLGAAEAVADALGPDSLIVGVAQGFGASLKAPGHAHHNDMKAIRMGAYAHLAADEVQQVVHVWRDAGFDAAAAHDILAMQWEKLICNVAYSAPCALTGLTVGEVMDHPDAGIVSRAAATEAWMVAKARGVAINVDDPVALVREFARRMPDARPSVLQDIEAGRISEVDAINGAVPREADKAGLQAPVNAMLTALVRTLERRAPEQHADRSSPEAVKRADRQRRDAMIAGDVDALAPLLADDMIWTHSSGKKDTKTSFLERIASRAVDYQSLDVADDVVSSRGDIVLHHGTLTGRVVVEGGEKALRNRFLSVWTWSGSGLQLLAWQSTGF
jgi:2-dehydropantoate 2-reductase